MRHRSSPYRYSGAISSEIVIGNLPVEETVFLYRGEIVWNEYQKFERTGTKQRRRRKEDQLIKVDASDLRIISEEVWCQVQKRLETNQKVYARYVERTSKVNVGRLALRDIESPYLLSGMARCSHCGGPIEALGQDYSRRKGRFYGCAYHRKRGTAICQNGLRVEQNLLDQVVLRALSDKPLRYEVIEENGKQGFRITGEGSYLHLLNGVASPSVVSPTGLDGFCNSNIGWKIPFHGIIKAA